MIVAAVALAASAPSLRNGFVYDDVPAVADDARIRALGPGLVTLPYWGADIRDRLYRPLTTLSFAIDRAMGGGAPLPFHATNVALNLAVALLVLALARRVLGNGPAALVASLWFAVHPVHVEAMANVVGRSELLAAAGYLAAVLAYCGEAEAAAAAPAGRRRALLAAGTLAMAVIAFGGKEHALTLPAALLLADLWRARERGAGLWSAWRVHALTWLGVVAVAAGFLAARAAVVGSAFGGGAVGAGLEDLGVSGRAMVMTPAALVWARLLTFPARLSADYSPAHFAPVALLTWRHVLAAVLVVGAGLAAWTLRRRAGGVWFGLAWLAVTGSVAANVVVPTGVMLAERTLYLPSVGAALAVGALWTLLPDGAWRWPATAAVLALLAGRTLTRIPVWRDGERFYAALQADAPDSYRARWAAGARAFERGRQAEGERAFLDAVRIYPGDAAVLQELGEHYLTAGAWEPADRWLTLAWRIDARRADAAIQAVLARLRLGRPDSAAALGEAALAAIPDAPTLLIATGDAWTALGRPVRALTLRRRAVFAQPGAWQFQHLAAEQAARAGRCDEAVMRAERAVAMAPAGEEAPRRLRALLRPGAACGLAA